MSVLFPGHCRICQAPLTRMARLPVCEACLDSIQPSEGLLCAACGERLVAFGGMNSAATLCLMCQANEPSFTRASAYGSYDGGLREMVHLLKYERVRPAANVLGRMLAEVVADVAEAFGAQPPVVMAVPLHASKLRQRGFNQSELIARAMLKLKPAALDVKLNTTALVRHRATESQTGLTPPQRRENVKGAFRAARGDQVSGRDILLVDDVFTTGTTVSECARVLRRAGARRVFVATVARVLKPEAERVEPPRVEDPGHTVEEERLKVMAAHA